MNTTGQGLSETLAALIAREESGAEVTVAEVFRRIGDRGFGLLLLILSLPSALPVPAPGYSTPFGVLLALLAIQMVAGRRTPWLPAWAGKRKFSGGLVDRMVPATAKFFSKVEKLVRPRMRWVGSRAGLPFLGVLVFIMAFLMILPIPLTNTAPAMVIFLIGFGLCEEDGLFCLAAAALAIVATALYSYVLYLFAVYGLEGIERLKDAIKAAIGLGGG